MCARLGGLPLCAQLAPRFLKSTLKAMLVQPALVEYQKLTGARLDRGDVCKLFVSGVQVDGNAKLSTYVLPSGEPTGVVIQVHAHARAHARARDPRCVQACSTA